MELTGLSLFLAKTPIVLLPGEVGNSNGFRMSSESGGTTTATTFISDGATLTVDNPEEGRFRSLQIGVNFGAFNNDPFPVEPGGQSVDATLVIEGLGTLVSIEPSDIGNDGTLEIGHVNDTGSEVSAGFVDPTVNRSADGLTIVRDGASLEVGQFISLGDENNVNGATANGSLFIEGSGTSVTVGNPAGTSDSGFMRIAEEGGTGSLVIRDGAELTLLAGADGFGGGIQLSGASNRVGGDATLIATGAGTRVTAEQGQISVGRNVGDATFLASDGASIETVFFTSGRSGSGETIFEGEGTTLDLSGAQTNPEFGAFLTVGRDTDGTFIVRDGADVSITGDGGEFPGFQAGRNDGGEGVVTVTGASSTIIVNGANNLETGEGETGFIRAGRDANSEGTINVLDGGVITNDPSGLLIVAQNLGSTGAVTVDGAGSVFDFGGFARLSDDTPGDLGGDSTVTISDGGIFRGDEIENSGILSVSDSGGIVVDDLVVTSLGILDLDGRIFGGGANTVVDIFGSMLIAGGWHWPCADEP